MNFNDKWPLAVIIAKQGAGDGLPQSGCSPSAIKPVVERAKPDKQDKPEHHRVPNSPHGTRPSRPRSCFPDADVKQFDHAFEDDQQAEVRRSQRKRICEEGGGRFMPPLVPSDPNWQIADRSRLWGLWADSVQLQRKIEYVRDAAKHSIMETRVERSF